MTNSNDDLTATTLAVAPSIAGLLSAVPGVEVIEQLLTIDDAIPSDADRVDVLRCWDNQISWAAAMRADAIMKLVAPPGGSVPELIPAEDWARDEIGAALRLPAATADRLLRTARGLHSRAPGSAELLRSGVITHAHAECLVEESTRLPDHLVSDVEDRVLARAAEQSVPAFRRAVRRAVLAVDPVNAHQAHNEALNGRYVRCWPDADGMAGIEALLSAEDATRVMNRIRTMSSTATMRTATAAMASTPEEQPPRSADQRRADALVALVCGTEGPAEASIMVTVRAETLSGADDEPAELAGYGPITATTARRIAADSAWRKALVDPARGTCSTSAPASTDRRRTRPLHHHPRSTLHRASLRDSRCPLRSRPHPVVHCGRKNHPCQPRRPLPTTPPRQTRSRLAPHP